MHRLLLALLLLLSPAWASAQAIQRPHADLPSPGQPVRNLPATGYTLALSWAPEYCHSPQRRSAPECLDHRTRGGFTLHGLWPDGDGPDRWPQYCHPVTILTEAQLRAGLRATPSSQLLQHEWAKHGSCVGDDPATFFAEEGRLFARVRYPDMMMLAHRRGLTAGAFQSAFAAANPGMTAEMMRLNVNRRGWLQEVWLCLGLDKRARACPPDSGGASFDQPIKVQAPSR